MPAKNIVKLYTEGGYYHIYNRGVEKRDIFIDEQDCKVFLHYLKLYLSPVDELITQTNPGIRIQRFVNLNLSKEVDLLAFALMPNHIHLQIKQHSKDGIVKFMRRLSTSYVMYFNRKYGRVGALFQNRYKGCLVESEAYLLHLSRYIHLNPIRTKGARIDFANFSSYPYYLGKWQASWIKPKEILSYFNQALGEKGALGNIFSYQGFVEDYLEDSQEILGDLTLEEEF